MNVLLEGSYLAAGVVAVAGLTFFVSGVSPFSAAFWAKKAVPKPPVAVKRDQPKSLAPGVTKPVILPLTEKPHMTKSLSRWDILASRSRATKRSEADIDVELKKITAFLAERKKSTRQFAAAILDADTKLKLAAYRGRDFVEVWGVLANRLAGGKAVWSKQGEKQLAAHIAKKFGRHVFSETDLAAVVASVYEGYLSCLKEIENQFLVELELDVEGAASQKMRLNDGSRDFQVMAGTIKATADELGQDFGNTMVRECASLLIGDLIGGQLAGENDSGLAKFGKSVTVGVAVDTAIEAGMTRSGYDSVQTVATRVDNELDRMHVLLVEGDKTARNNWDIFRLQKEQPYSGDAIVSDLCTSAMAAIERSGKLGMRWQLAQLCEQGMSRRYEMTKASWNEAPAGPIDFADVAKPWPAVVPREELIRFANECIRFYGGDRK